MTQGWLPNAFTSEKQKRYKAEKKKKKKKN